MLSFSISLVLKRRVPPSSHPGTSGDTGSAAIESVQRAENVDIIVLLPKGRCTKIQELQMTTVLRENVHVFGGECWDRGSGDSMALPRVVCFGRWAGTKLVNQLADHPSSSPFSLLPFLHQAYLEVGVCLDLALSRLVATQFQKLLEVTGV